MKDLLHDLRWGAELEVHWAWLLVDQALIAVGLIRLLPEIEGRSRDAAIPAQALRTFPIRCACSRTRFFRRMSRRALVISDLLNPDTRTHTMCPAGSVISTGGDDDAATLVVQMIKK
jgi:hypothetical protein